MAEFTPSKKTAQDFNGGQQYVDQNVQNNVQGDSVQAQTINNLVESALYSQQTADNANQNSSTALANSASALSQVENVINDKTLMPEIRKNYYNMGKFDTVATKDGNTDTVTRKTQYNEDGTQTELPTQYQYPEDDLKDQPIRHLPKAGEDWLYSEWRKGLNLLDLDTIGYVNHKAIGTDGEPYTDYNYFYTNYLPVKPNTKYTLTEYGGWVACYSDKTGNTGFISPLIVVNPNNPTFTTPPDCHYIRISNKASVYGYNLMVTEGKIPYPYEPYYGNIIREKDFDRLILETEYPVGGKPYIQYPGQPTPAERWANTTWERDTDYNGRMLIGATGEAGTPTTTNPYPLGNTGGSPDAVIVSHTHKTYVDGTNLSSNTTDPISAYAQSSDSNLPYALRNAATIYEWKGTTNTVGESGIGKNLSPYLAVNYWKRIS